MITLKSNQFTAVALNRTVAPTRAQKALADAELLKADWDVEAEEWVANVRVPRPAVDSHVYRVNELAVVHMPENTDPNTPVAELVRAINDHPSAVVEVAGRTGYFDLVIPLANARVEPVVPFLIVGY